MRLLRPKQAFDKAAISESTARRTADWPRPITLSTNRRGTPARIAYVEAEIDLWIERRVAAARGAEAA